MNKQTKPRGPQTSFAHLVDTGVRAYQRVKRINGVTRAMEDLAFASGIGFSTLSSWRRDVIPTDYDILKRFTMACVLASAELDESWVSDLLREAGMAGYRNQALAEIRNPLTRGTDATSKQTSDAARTINVVGSVPVLPDYYVLRQPKLAALKELTLARRDTGGWIAILGMTGAGKSTLMAALGHDSKINTAFAGNVRWLEIRQTTTTPRLAQRIATAFGADLSEEYASDSEAITALRHVLPDEPVLLLIDNVVDSAIVNPLHALGAGVVVVVTMRVIHDVALLHIPEKAWLTVGELTEDEAWALVKQIAPVPEEQIPAAKAVLQALEYHPYMTVVAASAALTLHLRWDQIQTALQKIPVRLGVIRFLKTKNRNVWMPLELDWEQLGKTAHYALTTLGRLPYFLHYDLPLAQAVWGLPDDEIERLWKTLAAMQLARPAPDLPDAYTVHWLIRDFAAVKARRWSIWQHLRFLGWPWRYRLPFRLRFWWPALPKPESAIRWPWWSMQMPGTEDIPGWRPIFVWLTGTLWQQDGRQLNLRAGPVEWVTVLRLTVRLLVASLAMLCLVVAAGLQNQLLLGIVSMVVMLWIIAVTFVDLRRAVMWWGAEKSLPLPEAFLHKRKGPAS